MYLIFKFLLFSFLGDYFDLVLCQDRGLDKGLAVLNIHTIEISVNFVFPLFRFQFMASEGQETVSKSPACTLSAL